MRHSTLRRSFVASVALAILAAASVRALQEAPLPGLSGGTLSADQLQQGRWIIVVWASWSPRCRDILERTASLQAQWGGKAKVVLVNFQEEPDKVRAFLAGQKVQVPVYLDGDAAFSKKHSITSLPGLLVLDNGRTAYSGKLPASPDDTLREALP
jgi:thiol-disulfide isomerase/thioredoxin